MEKMDMDHDGNVGGDEFLATLIDWGQVSDVGPYCSGRCLWSLDNVWVSVSSQLQALLIWVEGSPWDGTTLITMRPAWEPHLVLWFIVNDSCFVVHLVGWLWPCDFAQQVHLYPQASAIC